MSYKFTDIDGILVNPGVINTNFTCDLSKCKGACCTMESEYGAPLETEEIPVIEKTLPVVLKYLDEEKSQAIKENGFYEKKQGQYMTTSIDNKDCVFVYYENKVAKCAIEKAYFDGKVEFRKPISCHLFPIRISEFGGLIVKHENYSECEPALELGDETQIKIYEFCKDALERLFGEKWYQKLVKRIQE